MSVYTFQGSTSGASSFLCIKASATFGVKIIQAVILSNSGTLTISEYVGGGSITGGSTPTPLPLRTSAPAALATVRVGATAISGTATTIQQAGGSYTPPQSLILAAGSSTVFSLVSTGAMVSAIYFDELEIQPGY